MKRFVIVTSLLVGTLMLWLLLRTYRSNPLGPGEQQPIPNDKAASTGPSPTRLAGGADVKEAESPVAAKITRLKESSLADFNKLVSRLPIYGQVDPTRKVHVQCRTNRLKGINVDLLVRSTTHEATFIAGPVDASGTHINPFHPDGNLLTQFQWLYQGSDPRRKPESMSDWYRSTGQWSEQEAVAETMRLLDQLGIPASRVVRHRWNADPVTVQNPEGQPVRVTPFHRVDVYDTNDPNGEYAGFLYVEYRVDDAPPGRITRISIWPPIKVP